jgi:putative acetyltransferase
MMPGKSRAGATEVSVRRESLQSDAARRLIAALNAELAMQYPEAGANHFRLDPEEIEPGRGTFVVAVLEGKPVGCGALRLIGNGMAELKRMYVDPSRRGQGIGRRILEHLEGEARRLGASALVLETGDRQVEAISLYRRSGFFAIPPFGEYLASPLSRCLGKTLDSTSDCPEHPGDATSAGEVQDS